MESVGKSPTAARRSLAVPVPATATAAVAGAAVLYVVTRAVDVVRFPPFVDEVAYATLTLQGFEHASDRLASLQQQLEPMVMWIGMALMALGAGPLTAVRLVSLFAGLLTLAAVTLLAHEVGGRRTAATAAVLYVLVPYFVVHDSLGLLDPLVAAVSTWALYLQIRLARRPRLDLALLLGLAFAVGLLTKSTAAFAVALLPFSLLVFDWSPAARLRRLAAWAGCVALAISLGLLGHALTKLSDAYVGLSPSDSAPRTGRSTADALAQPWHWLASGSRTLVPGVTGYLTLPVTAAAIVGLVVLLRRQRRLGLLLLCWIALPLVADLLLSTEQYPRLVLSAMPPAVVAAAVGAVRVAEGRLGDRRRTLRLAALVALVPALALDAAVVASPATARYPGPDDEQLATGWAAGGPWPELSAALRRAAAGRRVTVAETTLGQTPTLLLHDDPDLIFMPADNPEAYKADFVVVNPDPLPPNLDRESLRVIGRWQRPRGGAAATLYERGAFWHGRFYTSPDELRASLGLSDAEFDRFLAGHSRIAHWYHLILGS